MGEHAIKPNLKTSDQGTSDHGNGHYKKMLDEMAMKAKNPEGNGNGDGSIASTLVETVSQYVPALGKVLGQEPESDPKRQAAPKTDGPPHRPDHDSQIEEFVRDQHRSKDINGVMQ